MRRNRRFNWLRRIVEENHLTINDLILPIFVKDGMNIKEPINSMPNVHKYSLDRVTEHINEAYSLGVPAIVIFPEINPKLKTKEAHEAINPDNLICKSIRHIVSNFPDLGIICDVALDPFNSDGHDGLLLDNYVVNDSTVEILCQQALVQAEAGCNIIAPSDMMDGRVAEIRKALDSKGYIDVGIMSYTAKFASAFYGPFRDAIGTSQILKGDKRTYQINPANINETMRQVAQNVAEGSDILMVKPGLPYLDVLSKIKEEFRMPTIAYQVSGEYAMLKGAIQNGWLDNDKAIMESLIAFKRAGADGILTYLAIEACNILNKN
ncbi:MAG: porphobilinogen synthase [Rhodospirillaceae bacterium]|nr:porphobilinogen synthase [Rhodospirillaceae bacterium]OUT80000.1 MAG: delta-aminolevulinic acid dehydratase [Rhodospirillaceae bacterium TMED23]